jgi:hypothetical protein
MGDRWWRIDAETWEAFTADAAASEEVLLTSLNAKSYVDNQRAMVVFEYIFGVLTNCREMELTYEQASSLLAVNHQIFSRFVTSPSVLSGEGDTGSREEAIDVFKAAVKELCTNQVISAKHCELAARFFASAFIRNFDAYQYALTNLPKEKIQTKLLCVQTPHILPSLSDTGTLDSTSTIA